MKKGNIILIPFPFSDLKRNKIRPAVVLCENEMDVTISFITSELKWKTEYDVPVFPTQNNGLKVPSVIRVGKIATIDSDLVLGELGDLSDAEMKKLNEGLKGLLQLS